MTSCLPAKAGAGQGSTTTRKLKMACPCCSAMAPLKWKAAQPGELRSQCQEHPVPWVAVLVVMLHVASRAFSVCATCMRSGYHSGAASLRIHRRRTCNARIHEACNQHVHACTIEASITAGRMATEQRCRSHGKRARCTCGLPRSQVPRRLLLWSACMLTSTL